jgi:citrate synthase
MTTDAKPRAGLEDVIVGRSAICFLDGERGILSYQGFDIHDLADAERGVSFEECCYLLWHGRLPNRAELGDLQTQLAAARRLPDPILRAMRMLPPVDGMDALRTLVSMLAHHDPDVADRSPQAQLRKAVRLTGQIAALVATWGRPPAGGPSIPIRGWAMRPTFSTCSRAGDRRRPRRARSTSRSSCTPTTN